MSGVYYGKTRLPHEYQEVEYITSTGTQYIDSGYIHGSNTKIEVCAYITDYYGYLCGSYNISQGNTKSIGIPATASAAYARFGVKNFAAKHSLKVKIVYTLGNGYYKRDKGDGNPYTYTFDTYNLVNDNTIIISGARIDSSSYPIDSNGVSEKCFKGRIYYFNIYENNVLVRSYIPCYRKYDNEVGLYEIKEGKFYTNIGTGNFTKGSDIFPKDVYKCIPFYDDYKPLNVYSDGRKIAGWSKTTDYLICPEVNQYADTMLEDTYNDTFQYTLHGRTEVQSPPSSFKAKWNNSVINHHPSRLSDENITLSGTCSVYSFQGNDFYFKVAKSDSSYGFIESKLQWNPVAGHKYLLLWEATLIEGYVGGNIADGTPVQLVRKDNYAWYGCKIEDYTSINDDNVKLTFLPLPQTVYLRLYGVYCVDLTLLWGGNQLQHNTLTTMEMVIDMIENNSTVMNNYLSQGTEIEVDYPTGYRDDYSSISPINPWNIKTHTVKVISHKEDNSARCIVSRSNLNEYDEVNEKGIVRRFTKIMKIGDVNWGRSSTESGIATFSYQFPDRARESKLFLNYYKEYSTLEALADVDYGYYVRETGIKTVIFIKDKDYVNTTDFRNARGEGLIYYKGESSTVEETTAQKLITFPYKTGLYTNSDVTYSYKKFNR